eukprot:492834_1
MKRRADASPHGDGNNNESSVISNVDLCGTTHRRHIRRSVSFRDDKILDEANLWKEKTSTEQCENRSSLSFIQEHAILSSEDSDETICDEFVEYKDSKEESKTEEHKEQQQRQHQLPWNSCMNLVEEWMLPPRYKFTKLLGHGSYGEVIQGQDTKASGKDVAIKRIANIFAVALDAKRIYREMYILRKLKHPQIIGLLDVFTPNSVENLNDIYLVFECMETDLYKLIQSPQFLTDGHIQAIIYQILLGLRHIHSACVIHRDLKPANILLKADCSLKICDFGLSRVVDPEFITMKSSPEDANLVTNTSDTDEDSDDSYGILSGRTPLMPPTKHLRRQLTEHVVTRWYRAPELILRQDYNSAVDVWSLGCIYAELLGMQKESEPDHKSRFPLFPGTSCFPFSGDINTSYDDQLDQLSVILSVIGTPTPEDVDATDDVSRYMNILKPCSRVDLASLYRGAKPEALELVSSMLQFNPKKRICVSEALCHKHLSAVHVLNTPLPSALPVTALENLNNVDRNVTKQLIYDQIMLFKEKPE